MRKLSQAILFVGVMCVNCNLYGADIIALDFNRAYGVSSDGKKIAGYQYLTPDGYSLTVGSSRVLLSKSNWAYQTTPTDISSDGSTIVGWASSISQNFYHRAVRWTQNGITDLGVVNTGDYSLALAVSSNGSVIVGWSSNDIIDSAFRWTQSTGMVKIASGIADDVSGDGSIVVGVDSTSHAFRWTAVTGAVNFLGDSGPINYATESDALGISTNGKYIVGRYQAQRAFIWSETDGIKDLGFALSGGDAAVTNDGNVAVFSGRIYSFWNGYTNSPIDLKSYLTDGKATGIGVWSSIQYVNAITGDNLNGYNITGYGNVSGVGQRAFLIRGLTFPVPEPSSYLLAVIATSVIVVLVRERKLVNLRSI